MTKDEEQMAERLRVAGHVLVLNKEGEVDWFAYEDDENCHNGPRCSLCGDAWCQHCWSPRGDDEKCVGLL